MALQNYPECGKEISSSADKRPNCGYKHKKFKYDKKLLKSKTP